MATVTLGHAYERIGEARLASTVFLWIQEGLSMGQIKHRLLRVLEGTHRG